jgi:hypothetical protein
MIISNLDQKGRNKPMQAVRIPQTSVEAKTNPLAALTGRFELVIADPDPLGIFGFALSWRI